MKKISLSEWAAIAEIVATLGLIASIAFVAYSINQNTRALQASNDNILYEMQDKLYAAYVDNDSLVSTGWKLVKGEQASPVERSQYNYHLWRYFNVWEMAYDRYHEGLLSQAKWDSWSRALEIEATYPPLGLPKDIWEDEGRETYSVDFARYVDAIYSKQDQASGDGPR